MEVATHTSLITIATCHRRAFPNTLSSKLGQALVVKMLSWYLDSPKRFLFYIAEDNKCVGYCGGMVSDGTQVHGSASGMIQHSFRDAFYALLIRPWLWVHPDLLSRYKLIFKNIYFKLIKYNKPHSSRTTQPIEPQTGLVVIGVDPEHQGRGYGTILLKEFERITREKGIHKMMLTVMSNNIQAIKAYEKNGWSALETKSKSTAMVKYLK